MFVKSLKNLLFSAFLAVAGWASPSLAAGTIPLAMAQQVDINGAPLANCQVYFFVAGTPASPQNAFSDFALSQALPNPLSCDQSGRIPMFWLADGLIHVRLTDSSGLQIIDTTMQVLGPSSGGGGGGGTVDPTTVLATGDEKVRYGAGSLAGFVRENGLTIGNATSGASERANSDTQALFVYLYNTDPNLVVSGGRGSNALADYNANKTISLPDMRGRINAFLDDMGNTAAGRLSSPYFASPTTLGAAGGLQNMPGLATSNLPPYTPTGSVAMTTASSGVNPAAVPSGQTPVGFTTGAGNAAYITANFFALIATFSGAAQGGTSTPFGILPPIMLRTQYIKL